MAARKPGAKRKSSRTIEAQIVAAALAIGEDAGWDAIRLRSVAERVGLSLDELRAHVRDQDAIADLWFRRALDAMLAPLPRGFAKRPAADRIEFLLHRWFDALNPYRRLTAEMLAAKMWVFHPHHYVPMVFNLSRLIQLLRDAAGLDATGRRRQIEEIGLTALFLATLAFWCRDESDGQRRSRAFLAARLAQADGVMARFFGGDKKSSANDA